MSATCSSLNPARAEAVGAREHPAGPKHPGDLRQQLVLQLRRGHVVSIVKQTTPEKRPSANGIAVASPLTISTPPSSFCRRRAQ